MGLKMPSNLKIEPVVDLSVGAGLQIGELLFTMDQEKGVVVTEEWYTGKGDGGYPYMTLRREASPRADDLKILLDFKLRKR